MVKNQFGTNTKIIRPDNAKDYFNLEFNSFCQKEGIILSLHVLTHLNRMGLLKGRMNTRTN